MPRLVKGYSGYMKGVDYFNKASSYYRFPHSSWKWYRTIFNWLLEVALNNAYYLYKTSRDEDEKVITFLQFRMDLIKEWQIDYNHQKVRETQDISSDLSESSYKTTEKETSDYSNGYTMSMDEEIMLSDNERNKKEEAENESEESILNEASSKDESEGEDECRLLKGDVTRDCNICSLRRKSKKRKRTSWFCANEVCQIPRTRSDRALGWFMVCPECFHIHLKRIKLTK